MRKTILISVGLIAAVGGGVAGHFFAPADPEFAHNLGLLAPIVAALAAVVAALAARRRSRS